MEKKINNTKKILFLIFGIILFISFTSATDIQTWQGKYLTGNPNTMYTFNLTVYDDVLVGDSCWSNTVDLETNSDRWWYTDQIAVAEVCNDPMTNYYLNIEINGADQVPRRMLKELKYADLSINNIFMGDIDSMGTITAPRMNVSSGDTFYLGWMEMKNEGTHTSIMSDLGIHEDTEPTAYAGIYAHNDSVMVHANLILEAGPEGSASTANFIKNSPLHPWSPNSSGITNEGSHGTYVPYNNQISWGNFDNLSKDENGNILYLYGMQRLAFLNGSNLYLERVGLDVNKSGVFGGNVTANYFIGDGSQLTGIVGVNSSWNESYADTLYYGINNPNGYYNITDFNIANYSTLAQILGLNYYNSSDFDINDYYLNSNPSNFYNSSDFLIGDYRTLTNNSFSNDLDVTGNITANYFFGDGSELTNFNKTETSHWTPSGNDVYYNVGNVGIGTSDPEARLEVKSSGNSTNPILVTNSLGNTLFYVRQDAVSNGQINIHSSSGASRIQLLSYGDSYLDGGNVGIGTDSPQNSLNVVGDLNVTGISYLGDIIISADNITVNNILPKDDGSIFVDGDVGIGTSSPDYDLSVAGSAIIGQDVTSGKSELYLGEEVSPDKTLIMAYDHDNNLATFRLGGDVSPLGLTIVDGGDVGIGTTSPSSPLSVHGGDSEDVNDNVLVAQFGSNVQIGEWTGIGLGAWDEGTSKSGILHKRTAGNGRGDLIFASNYESNTTSVTDADAVLTIQGSTKNVGIGTDSPSVRLEIDGDVGIGRVAGGYTFREAVGGAERAGIHSNALNELIFNYANQYEGMRINVFGNVGIGTNNPQAKLDVNGSAIVNGDLIVNNSDLFVDVSSGKVGMGVTNPAVILDVAGTSTNGKSLQIRSGDGTGQTDSSQIILSYGGNSYDNIGYAHSIRTRHNGEIDEENAIDFWLWNNDTANSSTLGDELVMTLAGDGNVGIGTSDPQNTLNVVGDLNVTGTSYLGNLVLNADNISVNNLLNLSGNGIRVWSDLWVDNNVGIGITNPSVKLDVNGSVNIDGNLNITDNLTIEEKWVISKDTDYQDALRISDIYGNNYLDFRNDTFKPSIQFQASVISRGSGNASSSNFGFGWLTLDSATLSASDNFAVGSQALYDLIDGNDNFAVGQNAGESATISSGSFYAGNYAGYANDEDNKLFIGNSDTSGRTIIEGDMGAETMVIRADLTVNKSLNAKSIYVDFPGTNTRAIEIKADYLTTGKALYIESNSAETDIRNLVHLINNNVLSVGTTVLKIEQESTGFALHVVGDSLLAGSLVTGDIFVSSFTTEHTGGISGTQNSLSVTDESIIGFDTSSIVGELSGFSNGVAGQRVTVIKDSDSNNLIIRHEDALGTQKIRTPYSADVVLSGYGGVDLVFDGSYWYVVESPEVHPIPLISSTAGNYDVHGVRIIMFDTTSTNIDVYGFTNGVTGQLLTVYQKNGINTLSLKHNHASGTQKIVAPSTVSYDISNYGGVDLFFDGTYWRIIDR